MPKLLSNILKNTNSSGLSVSLGGTGVMTLTGLVKANGANPFVAATAGTDYLIPGGNLANCTNLSLTSGVTGTLPVANGGTGVTISTGSGNTVLSISPTLTTPVLTSYSSIQALLETATVSASAPTSTTNFDVISQAVQYYTSNSTTNFTLNFRGNGSIALNSVMATGQSATIALLVTNSTTAYYPNVIQIDGTTQTVKWQNGTAISAGSVSAIDVYTFTIIKTGANTYTVLGSQTKFA